LGEYCLKNIRSFQRFAKLMLYNRNYFEPDLKSGYKYGYFPEFKWLAIALYQRFHPKTSLDIGCATGNLVQRLLELGVDAYGVDISAYAISRSPVKDRLKQVDIVSERLPFESNYFDLITMLEVIEHISNEENILKEMRRVLKEDGIIYITTPTPKAPPTPEHINIHTESYWVRLFRKYGFDVEIIKPLYSYTWDMAKEWQEKWRNLPSTYKIKNRPKIVIKFIENLPLFIRILIFYTNGKFKKFKNNRLTYRFLLKKI